ECCAAARGPPIHWSPGPRSAIGIVPSGGRSFPGSGWRAMTSTLTARDEATFRGLRARKKELPTVWLYDERGSRLYEEVTELPEYYLPQHEREILRARAEAIAKRTQARTLVEL